MSYITDSLIEEEKTDSFSKPIQAEIEGQEDEEGSYQFRKILAETHSSQPQPLQPNPLHSPDLAPQTPTIPIKQNLNPLPISQQLQDLHFQNQHLQRLNIQANQKISQLQNLDGLYQREAMLLNCEIERTVADNVKLTMMIDQMKSNQRAMGIKFDTSTHQLETCKQEYQLEIRRLREKCKEYQYKLEFQASRMDAEKRKELGKQDKSWRSGEKGNNHELKGDVERLGRELEKEREKVKNMREGMKNDQKEWLKCRQEWNEMRSRYEEEISELCDSNKTLNDSISEIVKKYSELEEKVREADTIKIDKSLLELQLSELKKQLESYQYDLTFAEQRIEELMEQLEDAYKENNYLEDKISSQGNIEGKDDSEELISEIDLIGKQIGELKEQFIKLSPKKPDGKVSDQMNLEQIKRDLGVLVNNPSIKKLLEMAASDQRRTKIISMHNTRNKSKSIEDEEGEIIKQMSNLIQDVVNQLNDQKRSRRILQQTVIHLQSQVNSYKSSSYQQIPSRLSLGPLKSMKYEDPNELSFKKNSSFQAYRTESNKSIGRKRGTRDSKRVSGTQSHISLIMPAVKPLKNIIENYVSKQALLRIMYRVTEEVSILMKSEKVNLTSESILISGYQSLNPERIDVVIQNISQPHSLYASPEILSDQSPSPQTVIWSLGVLFDEMVHKKHFFNSENEIKNPYYKYVFKSFSFRELKPLISNCLEKDQELRPSIEEVLENIYEIELNSY